MLDDVEEPVRAAMPQITRAVKLANGIVDQVAGPVEHARPRCQSPPLARVGQIIRRDGRRQQSLA